MPKLIDQFLFRYRRRTIVLDTFPRAEFSDEDGFLCAGGNFEPDTLQLAYDNGIFPWPCQDADYVWWFSPKERFVLDPEQLHVPKSLARTMRRRPFKLTTDMAFRDVMTCCSEQLRPVEEGEPYSEHVEGTWILPEMIEGYTALHARGRAHSVEAWLDGELVGGLYGVTVGSIFCGESMFAKVSDASKVAFATFVPIARKAGFSLIDCQAHTNNLERFGAHEIPQEAFFAQVVEARSHAVDWCLIKKGLEEAQNA